MKRLLEVAIAIVMAIIVMTLCFGCGQTAPTLPKGERLYFTGEPVTEAQMAWSEDEFDRKAECVGFYRSGVVRPLEIHSFPGVFLCVGDGGVGGQGVFANGCMWTGRIAVNAAVYEAALSHELIHWFQMKKGYAPDYQHTGPDWTRCL